MSILFSSSLAGVLPSFSCVPRRQGQVVSEGPPMSCLLAASCDLFLRLVGRTKHPRLSTKQSSFAEGGTIIRSLIKFRARPGFSKEQESHRTTTPFFDGRFAIPGLAAALLSRDRGCSMWDAS